MLVLSLTSAFPAAGQLVQTEDGLVQIEETEWRIRAVPFIGHPADGGDDGLDDGTVLVVDNVAGLGLDFESPFPWLGFRARVSRTIGAKAHGAGGPFGGHRTDLGTDIRLSPVPRTWLIRPFVAYGILAIRAGHDGAPEGRLPAAGSAWYHGQSFGIGTDVDGGRWGARLELTRSWYQVADATAGHFLFTAGLLIPLN